MTSNNFFNSVLFCGVGFLFLLMSLTLKDRFPIIITMMEITTCFIIALFFNMKEYQKDFEQVNRL